MRSIDIPITTASVFLAQDDPAGAVEALEKARPYEHGQLGELWTFYLRGIAYLELGDAEAALQEFSEIRKLGGLVPLNPLHVVARLGVARALAASGDVEGSRREYEAFLSQVEGGDPGVPLIKQAQSELEALGSA